MITVDLKLLVDVAWLNRHSQQAHTLERGEYAAADRLVEKGLLVNAGAGTVGITGDGELLVAKLSQRVSRGS